MRQVLNLGKTWRFIKADPPRAETVDFDDAAWQEVSVPHDWAIAGPFCREHDVQKLAIVQDGETRSSEHVGRTGGLPHVGVGWYRRRLTVPAEWRDRRLVLEFDGVMSHSQVYVNGRLAGAWPFGYSSFAFDITPHIQCGQDNLLAVRCDNKPCASRWYPGAGIYRNVRLVVAHPVHIAHWGVWVTTPEVSDQQATIRVRTELCNRTDKPVSITLRTTLMDPDGLPAASNQTTVPLAPQADHRSESRLTVEHPQRWDIATPCLYRAVTELLLDGKVADRIETPFGIRTIAFDCKHGFFLNGRHTRLNGVCMHHDLGALGTAIHRRALERQLEILKDMGCNAIRTSHNPPAPELLELCDALGFVVMDEAFDEWKIQKVDNGYHILFNEWAEKDLRAMIRRDRNHPCVVMYSIGNEIGEQNDANGATVARFLHNICHDEDPTRPTTAGFNIPDGAIKHGLATVVDLAGWNYQPHRYAEFQAAHPEWVHYGSETASCVGSRGEYTPSAREDLNPCQPNLQIADYGLAMPSWGYPPDKEFAALADNPFALGEFVWTGFDYLGEPTPYKTEWPSRSSYFGIVDLCGFPKSRYYLYRSVWSDRPTLHLVPHWTWPGMEGKPVPVHVFTNRPAAELFLNGRSLGVRRKTGGHYLQRFRLAWDEVPYEPGELTVVALDHHNIPRETYTVRTAGQPARLDLQADRTHFLADGDDLSFVTVRILDAEGTPCPLADHRIQFSIEGPGDIAGVDNGDATSLEPFQASERKAFHGMCLVIIRGREGQTGAVTLRAGADDNLRGQVTLSAIIPPKP